MFSVKRIMGIVCAKNSKDSFTFVKVIHGRMYALFIPETVYMRVISFALQLTRIGAKFMYVAGVMVCGAGTVIFGSVSTRSMIIMLCQNKNAVSIKLIFNSAASIS